MKRIVMLSCLLLFMLTANQVIAQEKIKVTDDKTKIKTDTSIVKTKDDKTKVKSDTYKRKTKDDKTKVKAGDDKTKIKTDGVDDKTKVKVDDDKTKIKTDDDKTKIKVNDDKTKIKTDNNQVIVTNPGGMNTNPYTASYSSNYVIGNPAHTNMVVDMWRDWDDNAFDRQDYYADTLTMILPDGTVTKGKVANQEGAKKFRGGLKSSRSTIEAMIPLRSTDRNEDWVAIWGTETNTWPDGKVETRDIHEMWRINKDGKVDMMRQFQAKHTPLQ